MKALPRMEAHILDGPHFLLETAGPGYPAQADSVMAVFGAAAERDDPRMRNVYFDVATAVTAETSPETAALVARRIRQVRPPRVLYGSDLTPPGGASGRVGRSFATGCR